MNRRVRWGIVATGTISRQMTSDLKLVADADVVAVSSRHADSSNSFADEFDILNRFDDYAAFLNSDIDAVYIGTPHATHFAFAESAILAGKHVLCEKPLGLDATEVRTLSALARRHEVFLMEAMWMKFNPLYERLVCLLAEGRIGEVRSVQAAFGIPFPQDDSSRWKPEMRGSALLDQGIYPVTLAHMILGKPVSLHADGVVRADGIDLSEHFTLEYSDGRYAHGAASMVEFSDLTASICGSTGWITVKAPFWASAELTVHRPWNPDGEESTVMKTRWEGNGYVPMLHSVNRSILAGHLENSVHTNDAAADVFDVLDEIRRQL